MTEPTSRPGDTKPLRLDESSPRSQGKLGSSQPRKPVQLIITSKSPPEKEPGAGRKIAVGVVIILLGAVIVWVLINQRPDSGTTMIRQGSPQATSGTSASGLTGAPGKTGTADKTSTPDQTGATDKPTANATPTASVKIKYETVTASEWQAIAEEPDSHVGEALVLYGYVTEVDSAITGEGFLHVDTDAVRHRGTGGYLNYQVNAVLTAGTADLADLVEGDIFKLKGLITGSRANASNGEGDLTAPLVTVNSLTVLGSTSN